VVGLKKPVEIKSWQGRMAYINMVLTYY